MRSSSDAVNTLSGGNQQKIVIARALADRPEVLLLNDPTRGIDLSAKQDLYEVLQRLCDEGTAVVLLSTEVDELVNLVDRVLVFRDHALAAEIPRARLTRAAVVSAYFGSGTTVPEPRSERTSDGDDDALAAD
jgi:ABC-type sugar transport system ATPase subunit